MKRRSIFVSFLVLLLALIMGCATLQTKNPAPSPKNEKRLVFAFVTDAVWDNDGRICNVSRPYSIIKLADGTDTVKISAGIRTIDVMQTLTQEEKVIAGFDVSDSKIVIKRGTKKMRLCKCLVYRYSGETQQIERKRVMTTEFFKMNMFRTIFVFTIRENKVFYEIYRKKSLEAKKIKLVESGQLGNNPNDKEKNELAKILTARLVKRK